MPKMLRIVDAFPEGDKENFMNVNITIAEIRAPQKNPTYSKVKNYEDSEKAYKRALEVFPMNFGMSMGAMSMAMFIIVIPGVLSLNALWRKTDELKEARKEDGVPMDLSGPSVTDPVGT